MSFEEDKQMSFEDYAKWFKSKADNKAYFRQVNDEELDQMLRQYPWGERKIKSLPEIEDQIERVRRLGASKYDKSNYEMEWEKGLGKHGPNFPRRSAQIKAEDLRLTAKDLERLGFNKDGKFVKTVQLTRTRFAEEKDPLSEEVDPMRIAWVKPYIYSPKYQTGIIILFNNGDFRTYTQSFEYFKHKVQQIVGNMVLVGGRLPSLPWWSEQ